jgi:hypothetical protein
MLGYPQQSARKDDGGFPAGDTSASPGRLIMRYTHVGPPIALRDPYGPGVEVIEEETRLTSAESRASTSVR